MGEAFLHSLAHRLSVTASTTTSKAEELVRLLEVRRCSQPGLTSSARTIICLDLAAAATGAVLDKKLAIKLSGLTRPQYTAQRQTAARLLNLSSNVTVADLCRVHSIAAAKNLAQQVLALYEEQNRIKEVDVSLPVYPTAAVHAACCVLKVKVEKQRLYESSSSKRVVYNRLVEAMTTLAKTLHDQQQAGTSSNGKRKTLMELVEENLNRSPTEKRKKTDHKEEEGDTGGDFEEWKRKILSAAMTE